MGQLVSDPEDSLGDESVSKFTLRACPVCDRRTSKY